MQWRESHLRFLEQFNAELANVADSLPDHAQKLKDAMRYSLLAGGKRVRPFLVQVTGEILGITEDKLRPLALAIECIHTYSLIHDDLPAMDDDNLRRGKPTCHIAFDEATAILAGDALQTLAYELLMNATALDDHQKVGCIKALSGASGYLGMCGGQALDIVSTDQVIELTTLKQIHQLKTGALIKSAIEMVTVLKHDMNHEHRDQLHKFAEFLGLAFQVKDDILDIVGSTEELGKPQGSDSAINKSTYPGLLGLEGAQAFLATLHDEALQALAAIPYNTQLLSSFTDYVVNRNN